MDGIVNWLREFISRNANRWAAGIVGTVLSGIIGGWMVGLLAPSPPPSRKAPAHTGSIAAAKPAAKKTPHQLCEDSLPRATLTARRDAAELNRTACFAHVSQQYDVRILAAEAAKRECADLIKKVEQASTQLAACESLKSR